MGFKCWQGLSNVMVMLRNVVYSWAERSADFVYVVLILKPKVKLDIKYSCWHIALLIRVDNWLYIISLLVLIWFFQHSCKMPLYAHLSDWQLMVIFLVNCRLVLGLFNARWWIWLSLAPFQCTRWIFVLNLIRTISFFSANSWCLFTSYCRWILKPKPSMKWYRITKFCKMYLTN